MGDWWSRSGNLMASSFSVSREKNPSCKKMRECGKRWPLEPFENPEWRGFLKVHG